MVTQIPVVMTLCPQCGAKIPVLEHPRFGQMTRLRENQFVCPKCDHRFKCEGRFVEMSVAQTVRDSRLEIRLRDLREAKDPPANRTRHGGQALQKT
jgi:predicted RNA-binding Zn-ribbon protein involved in translation (DUF1610 family)